MSAIRISKMEFPLKFVIFFLCLQVAWCSVNTYKAAYLREDVTADKYARLIYEASKMNADIVVLPSAAQESCTADDNDRVIKSISDASKKGKLYVVAHLLEKMRCQGQQETIRNNLVFDRYGSIVAVYRKPLQGSANCNLTSTVPETFSTDFGATFGLLMEEDLLLKNIKDMRSIKNIVLVGKSSTNIPYLSANEFSSSWSYSTNANIVSSKGVFAGRAGVKTKSGNIVVMELFKNGGEAPSTISFNGPTKLTDFPGEDLSQYTIRPLDIEASAHSYHESVCHDTFCCDFHLTTSSLGYSKEVNYGLVAYSGVQKFDPQVSIGVQSCAVLACAGLYKRSCFLSSENSTNIVFDEITISANFTKNSAQFPIFQSTAKTTIEAKDFNIKELSADSQKLVTARLYNTKDVLRFGIFARDYSKDFQSRSSQDQNEARVSFDYSDYISSENVEEFFDYLWIRLRVVILLVSIYILEMM